MELRLQRFIQAQEVTSSIAEMDSNNPIVLRHSHVTKGTVTVVVCAIDEPRTLILPLNVTWICFDPNSNYYRQALRRVSKDTSAEFEHTWELIDTYAQVFVDQFYDAEDQGQLADDSIPVAATTTVAGIARLSAEAQNPGNPAVVVEGDSRLSDARPPLAHTHPLRPAEQLRNSQTVVTIVGGAAPVAGAVLIATSATSAQWARLKTSNIDN